MKFQNTYKQNLVQTLDNAWLNDAYIYLMPLAKNKMRL